MFVPPINAPQAKTASQTTPTWAPKPPQRTPLWPGAGLSNQAGLRSRRFAAQQAERLAESASANRQMQEADPERIASRQGVKGPSWDFSKVPVFAPDLPSRSEPPPPLLQRKVAIGPVNDPLEPKADRVADQVLRMPASQTGAGPPDPNACQLPPDSQMVDLDGIEYSTQPGISFSTQEGETLGRMAARMRKTGWDISQLADMVKRDDGLVSLDHRLNRKRPGVSSETEARSRFSYDTSDNEEDGPLLMSQTHGGPNPAPAPNPSVTPPSPPPASPSPAPAASPCTITTRTLVSAPDGTPDTRTTAGVNEQVQMTASTPATWSANSGTITGGSGTTVIWTAPSPALAMITATPAAGSPCFAIILAIPPTELSLAIKQDLQYPPGRAGSGFVADASILPLNVSFSQIEVREESVPAVATGYYDTVLHENGVVHPPSPQWKRLNANNGGFTDTVGAKWPGSQTPFSFGTYLWAIPQTWRIAGSGGSGIYYSTADHTETMADSSGTEITSKGGATRTRTP